MSFKEENCLDPLGRMTKGFAIWVSGRRERLIKFTNSGARIPAGSLAGLLEDAQSLNSERRSLILIPTSELQSTLLEKISLHIKTLIKSNKISNTRKTSSLECCKLKSKRN